jgi:hydrogenase-4 component B
MSAPAAVMAAIAICAAGGLLTLALARSREAAGWTALVAAAVSGGLVWYAAGGVLVSRQAQADTYLALPALGSAVRVEVDGLASLFLLAVAAVAVLVCLYSIGYVRHTREYGVARYYPYLLIFIAGMYGVLTTTDLMLVFCAWWQVMTLSSYVLIRYEYRRPENVRAAVRYLVVMEGAALVIMAGAWILSHGQAAHAGPDVARFDFEAIRHAVTPALADHPHLAALAFGLLLIGFGAKAGMWPLGQLWLPDAHPAAPSPVSALLSGVLIKTGVYGLMRTFLWMVPPEAAALYPAGAWGAVLAALGTATLLIGTAQALRQDDSKRLLAFSSIGQIGYILLALGIAVALVRPTAGPGIPALAALGLYGALFHTLNHATFKSLLFMNAGSIRVATGTQDLNRLGGLMAFMPGTAVTALVASLAIAGVPLFNGFASKWTIGVAAILGSTQAAYLVVCGVLAILTSALTLALYVKFFGVSFLSRTSALVAERAAGGPLEVDWTMRAPQVVLAAICVLLGLVPSLGFRLIEAGLSTGASGLVVTLAVPLVMTPGPLAPLVGVWLLDDRAVFAPLVLTGVLGLLMLATAQLAGAGASQRRSAEVWLCGYVTEAEGHRYAARNLYGEVTRSLGWLGGVSRGAPPRAGKTPGGREAA